jgi:hypothetical protein
VAGSLSQDSTFKKKGWFMNIDVGNGRADNFSDLPTIPTTQFNPFLSEKRNYNF